MINSFPPEELPPIYQVPEGHFTQAQEKFTWIFQSMRGTPEEPGTTWFHEHGHFIDGLAKKVSKSTSFKQALKSDVSAYEKAVKQANGFPHVEQARYAISAEREI